MLWCWYEALWELSKKQTPTSSTLHRRILFHQNLDDLSISPLAARHTSRLRPGVSRAQEYRRAWKSVIPARMARHGPATSTTVQGVPADRAFKGDLFDLGGTVLQFWVQLAEHGCAHAIRPVGRAEVALGALSPCHIESTRHVTQARRHELLNLLCEAKKDIDQGLMPALAGRLEGCVVIRPMFNRLKGYMLAQ